MLTVGAAAIGSNAQDHRTINEGGGSAELVSVAAKASADLTMSTTNPPMITQAEPRLESKAERILGKVPPDTLSLSKPPSLR